MMLKSWLRRVGINSLKRFVRSRRKIDGEQVDSSPATSAAPVCVAFPVAFQQLPDPVSQTFIGGVGPVDTVRSFLFGGQPGTLVNPSSTYQVVEGEPSSDYGGFRPPEGLPPDQLRARLWRVLASSDPALLPGPDSPVEWPGELMAFQLDGVKILIESQRLLLADDMGLGKTVQVIAALASSLPERRNLHCFGDRSCQHIGSMAARTSQMGTGPTGHGDSGGTI